MPSRMGWLGFAVAAFLLVPSASALACGGDDAPASSLSEGAFERSVRCLLNAERGRNGLTSLRNDARLARAAERFSNAMVAQRFFAHVSPSGSTLGSRARAVGFSGRALGETIAWGSGSLSTPAAIVGQWMNSPPHRAVILDADFHRVGLGSAGGAPTGVPDATTVTADFGG